MRALWRSGMVIWCDGLAASLGKRPESTRSTQSDEGGGSPAERPQRAHPGRQRARARKPPVGRVDDDAEDGERTVAVRPRRSTRTPCRRRARRRAKGNALVAAPSDLGGLDGSRRRRVQPARRSGSRAARCGTGGLAVLGAKLGGEHHVARRGARDRPPPHRPATTMASASPKSSCATAPTPSACPMPAVPGRASERLDAERREDDELHRAQRGQRHHGEDEPVQVVVDVEVARETGAGVPRLVPAALQLGLGEPGRPRSAASRSPAACRARSAQAVCDAVDSPRPLHSGSS